MALSYVGKMDWRFSPSAHLAFYADLFYKSEFVRLKTTLISKVALYVHEAHPTFISALTFFYTALDSVCNSIVFPVSNLSWGCFTAKLRAVSASGKAKPQWVAAKNLPLLPSIERIFRTSLAFMPSAYF